MQRKVSGLLSIGLGALAAACGGGGARPAGPVTAPARAAGGEVIRTQGTGQAVSVTAHQRFEEAARLMRQHDEANNGRGDWNEAICNEVAAKFESAANEQPGGAFAEAWFNRGLVFERCNMTEQARQSLQRALQVSRGGNYCRARVQLGVYQYRARQINEAMDTFRRAIQDDPNCVEGYTNLAMILRERGQGDDRVQAVANIRQALARDDRFIPALNQLALTYLADAGDDPRSQRLMLAGIVCMQAVQVTNQRGSEMTPEVRSYVADVYNTWGLIDIRAGQIIRALDHFRRAYQLNPNMFEAWVNYGTINLSFRGYADAREAFQHAVQLRPRDYDAHIGLGVALRGLGAQDVGLALAKQNEAINLETQAERIESDPEANAQARQMAAQSRQRAQQLRQEAQQLLQRGNPLLDQARQEYETARQIDPSRPEAYYNLGLLHQSYLNILADDRIPDLERANQLLREFLQRVGGETRCVQRPSPMGNGTITVSQVVRTSTNPRYADAVERAGSHICNNEQTISQIRQIQQVNAAANNPAATGSAGATGAQPATGAGNSPAGGGAAAGESGSSGSH